MNVKGFIGHAFLCQFHKQFMVVTYTSSKVYMHAVCVLITAVSYSHKLIINFATGGYGL
jgi:hypothetical protein